jgi:hypothetical protein
MSLTYAMIGTKAQQAAHNSGLDPQLGFLHAPRAGRPALSLDVIEPVRPIADIFAIGTLLAMQPSDFILDETSGCMLNKSAKRQYFSAWSGQQHHWLNLDKQKDSPEDGDVPVDTKPLHTVLRYWVNAINRDIKAQYESVLQRQVAGEMEDGYTA